MIDSGRYQFKERTFVLGAARQRVASYDPSRVTLLFSVPNAGGICTFSTIPAAPANQGLFVTTATFIDLRWNAHGSLTNAEWWAATAAGAPLLTVFEVIELQAATPAKEG